MTPTDYWNAREMRSALRALADLVDTLPELPDVEVTP